MRSLHAILQCLCSPEETRGHGKLPFHSSKATDQTKGCSNPIGLLLRLCQIQCFPAGCASLLLSPKEQSCLRQRKQRIEKMDVIVCFAQQLTGFFAQSHSLLVMPLSKCEKCQRGESGCASFSMSRTAVKGEAGLAKRYASLEFSLRTQSHPQIGLRLRDAQSIIKCLQQRNLFFQ